jgi:UDP-N-acetylmuramate dehydrogenase
MTSPLSIRENLPLAPLTTLGVGGAAQFFVEACSEEALLGGIDFARQRQLPVFILGGGSNVLIADEGFPGLVIRVAITEVSMGSVSDLSLRRRTDKELNRSLTLPVLNQSSAVMITAGAGEDWDNFVRLCVERNLAGVECLSGIPGFVGGTPVQNVGAYGQEVSETITKVRVLDRLSNQVVELNNTDCGFSYRASLFNTTARDRFVVLSVTYALIPDGKPAIRYPDLKDFFAGRIGEPTLSEVREAVIAIRARKGMVIQPDDPDCRSAGSFFKNPVLTAEAFARLEASAKEQGLLRSDERVPNYPAAEARVKVPAAWLIEHAGFQKGYAKGQAGISSKHTLAIINRGAATAHEVLELVKEIQQLTAAKFGVWLTPEPVFVGFPEQQSPPAF